MPSLIVETERILSNFNRLRDYGKVPVIPVLEGNACGLGDVAVARLLADKAQVRLFAVSRLEEAARLRAALPQAEILLLSPYGTEQAAKEIIRLGLTAAVGSYGSAVSLNGLAGAAGVRCRVHLRFETGLGQSGFLPEETEKAVQAANHLDNLDVTGCFSQLSRCKGRRDKSVAAQLAAFHACVKTLRDAGVEPGMLHIASSEAAVRCPDARLDAVRCGTALFGLAPLKKRLGLQRVGRLECPVADVRWLPAGHNVGYGNTFRAKNPVRVAVIHTGLADGLFVQEPPVRTGLFLHFPTLKPRCTIGGKSVRILGRPGMCTVTADVSDAPCGAGDTASFDADPRFINATLNAFIADAPLYRAVRGYADTHPLRLHTPGHVGCADVLADVFGPALALDVTELPPTDSLFEAAGPIREAEARAAETFGAASTLFSAGGATLCIQAMLRLAGRSGARKIVCARGAHRSAVSAMALLGLVPVWLWPQPAPGSALPGTVPPDAVEAALQRESGVAAVYVTSPDYYGELSDIAGISAVCRRYGVPLLVDAAHGAHLHYLQNGALHPLAQGAALVCDSAHKTLPVLTGGAWLQVGKRADVSRGEAKDAMALFGSSSPSYLILLSLDLARAWGQAQGEAAFFTLQKRVERLFARLAPLGLARPAGAPFDPVRVTLDVGRAGLSGPRATSLLRERGVFAEMYDDVHLVLLPSPFHTDADFERLFRALAALPVGNTPVAALRPALPHPQAVLTPGEALRAPRVRLPAEQLAGRIAAEGAAPCPPGVPLVCPGERITPALADMLKTYGVNALNVIK